MLQINACLRKAPYQASSTRASICPCWQGRRIAVQLYNPDGEIETVSAYSFNPYKQTIWQWVFIWLKELFFGRMTVLVKVENEPDLLYMRVNEISRVLRQPSDKLRQQGNKTDLTAYLIQQQKNTIFNKLEGIARHQGFSISEEEREKLKAVAEHIPYENLDKILAFEDFDQARLLGTFIQIGDYFLHPSASINKRPNFGYSFVIKGENIFISKVDHAVRKTINLFNLSLEEQTLSKEDLQQHLEEQTNSQASSTIANYPILNLVQSITNPYYLEKEAVFEQLNQLAQACHLQLMEKKYFNALTRRVHPDNLMTLLNQLKSREEKQVLLNTFSAIGQQLYHDPWVFSLLNLAYIKKKKDQNGKALSHTFAINKNEVIVVQNKLAEGGSKTVSSAILLNTLQPMVRIKFKNKDVGNEKLRQENELLHTLRKTNNPYLVVPYHCCIINRVITEQLCKERMIVFQNRYGTGKDLFEASAGHILNALKEIALGLSWLHQDGYIHGDIKPENLLIEGDINGQEFVQGKLSDFGMTVKKGEPLIGGSPFHFPAKVLQAISNSPARCLAEEDMDWFAFGITTLQILCCDQLALPASFGMQTPAENQEILTDIDTLLQQQHEPGSQELAIKQGLLQIVKQIFATQTSLSQLKIGQQLQTLQNQHFPTQAA
ncbi:protein kinase domain-containing protein [Candidatus Protochlamydia phocaeensis]|uniref:protein kinase domain-containing protein n=1 Tax=Candidatus Protochlamydia phocaeensis TaxID=1414722 RepID=UPI0008387A62|nr:protein kinase [Candidatus Protochlamydia phocaeensis]